MNLQVYIVDINKYYEIEVDDNIPIDIMIKLLKNGFNLEGNYYLMHERLGILMNEKKLDDYPIKVGDCLYLLKLTF